MTFYITRISLDLAHYEMALVKLGMGSNIYIKSVKMHPLNSVFQEGINATLSLLLHIANLRIFYQVLATVIKYFNVVFCILKCT